VKERSSRPRRDDLIKKLDLYALEIPAGISQAELEILKEACIKIDRIIRIALAIAEESVPADKKRKIIFIMALGNGSTPEAIQMDVGTGKGVAAYRVLIPISYIHKLLRASAVASEIPGSNREYYLPSLIIAALTVFAHELVHIFIGHLTTASSRAQELQADYLAGGIVWKWLQHKKIQKILPIADVDTECLYGFIHLTSILTSKAPVGSLYIDRAGRLGALCGGVAYNADKMGLSDRANKFSLQGNVSGACPDERFKSNYIEREFEIIAGTTIPEEGEADTLLIFEEVKSEKHSWYNASVLLGPIRRQLQKILKKENGRKK
jgi:hypothetical protein